MIELKWDKLKNLLPKNPNIKGLLKKIDSRHQGFYTAISDKPYFDKIAKFANQARKKYKHFVILGIGGSALSAKLFNDSLKKSPNIHIIDNVDPSLIIETEKKLKLKKTLFLVISKSGETIETLAQFQYFKNKVKKAKLKEKDHFVFISEENSALHTHAKKNSCEFFEIPKNIGGRFSAFTAVGLLPAALIGINIKKIIEGAKISVENFQTESPAKNLAFILASIQHALAKKGKTINVIFPYCQNLKTINAFYIQLLAESIGKNNKGITPISAKGATDQHSQLQLFTQGPNDKLFIFIEEISPKNDIQIPNSLENSPFKKPLTFSQLLKIEKTATEQSLNKNSRPNITIKIDQLNEKTLSELIMLLFCSISFLGELYGINAYDQPGVKLGKEITKKLLLK